MYEKSITREYRTAFVILIDQSGSMVELVEYEGIKISKSEAVALATNQILSELIERAKRHDGIRDYYDVAVIGYSGAGVRSMLTPEGSSEDDSPFVSIKELEAVENVDHMEYDVIYKDPQGEDFAHTISAPKWVSPQHTGETPTFEVLNYTYDWVKRWCSKPENHNSFPPIIFNITDGESSDCTPDDFVNISRKLRSLSTSDGNVFVINIHLATPTEEGSHQSMIFPTSDEVECCCHTKAKDLSRASSVMPSLYRDQICELRGINTQGEFVGVSYNSSIAELITILNIGTISVKKG
ncbi:MAG: VWA domain-containing protein [Rikenellaceae bacterium]